MSTSKPMIFWLVLTIVCVLGNREAAADFLGIQAEIKFGPVGEPPNTVDCANDLGLTVCNLHALFDTGFPHNHLYSVGFSFISSNAPAGFYQHPLGTDLSPECFLLPLSPDVQCDSFVTIGRKNNCPGDVTFTDADFVSDCFNNLEEFPFCEPGTIVGGWFNSNPDNDQGHPVEVAPGDWRVLIGQLSVEIGYNVSGTLTLFYDHEGVILAARDLFFECASCGSDSACDDGDACTTDGCDPSAGCTHDPIQCDDGNACTLDACEPGAGCVHLLSRNAECAGDSDCAETELCRDCLCVPVSTPGDDDDDGQNGDDDDDRDDPPTDGSGDDDDDGGRGSGQDD